MTQKLRSAAFQRVLTLAALIAPPLGVIASVELAGIDIVLAFITPDYNEASETISQMQAPDAAYAAISRLSLLAYAVLVIPFTIRLTALSELRRPWVWLMAFGLWVHVATAYATAGFQSESRTVAFAHFTVNDLHDAMGHIMYTAGVTGMVGFIMAQGGPLAGRLPAFSTAAAAVMIAVGLAFVLRIAQQYTGIEERIGYAAYLLWVGVVSVYLERVRRREARAGGEESAVTAETGMLGEDVPDGHRYSTAMQVTEPDDSEQ